MLKLNRYPTLFELCVKVFPSGGVCFSCVSSSDVDSFVLALMEDLGGDSAKEARRIKTMKAGDDYENACNDAYSNVQLLLQEFEQWYNDWAELERSQEIAENYTNYSSEQAMFDAGHKWSDF